MAVEQLPRLHGVVSNFKSVGPSHVRFGSKADITFRSDECPLYLHSTDIVATQTDVCFVPIADIGKLFDHFIGADEYGRRNFEAKSFRGFEINHQHVLVRRLHWEVRRLLAL